MCDSLCVIGPQGALFAKNSDRPSSEVQLIEWHSARRAGEVLHTTYLEIDDAGSYSLIGARPDWGWGLEHGVNQRRVAIGNQKTWTRLNPNKKPPSLTGMDLVRLGLERAQSADEALDVMTALLETHGQGGVCDQTTAESYFSSFLICDPAAAWVLETSGRSWAARRVPDRAALSNRISIGTDWTRASSDASPGKDWDERRHPRAPTAHADVRLAASEACLSGEVTPRTLAEHLRNHGDARGIPGSFDGETGDGVTVCMHLRGYQNTTSSMICELSARTELPLRAWLAPGQPCTSVYVPVFAPHIPASLGSPGTWQVFEALRQQAEADSASYALVRETFAPLEAELWAEADQITLSPDKHAAFVERSCDRVLATAHQLAGE